MDGINVTDVTNVINNWQTLGALSGAIIGLQLLVKLLKIKPIDAIFKKKKIKWVKPYLTVGIGIGLGSLSTYATGANVPQSVLAGALAATTSVGWNELLNKAQIDKRQK